MQNLRLSLPRTFSHTIIFVTHDVTEAVRLSDRILVMAKVPGRIQAQFPVDLPQPGKPDEKGFLKICREVRDTL